MKDIKKLVYTAGMGVGLGLGVTYTVLRHSNLVVATNDIVEQHQVIPTLLETNTKQKFSIAQEGAEITQLGRHGLGGTQSMILSATSKDLHSVFTEYEIGDVITIYGENNGRYVYTLTASYIQQRGEATRIQSEQFSGVVVRVHRYPWDAEDAVFQFSARQ